MPASLILEGLAQTGGILVGEAGNFAQKVVLAKIPKAEFHGVASAGDQLIYEVTLTDLRIEGAVVEAKAFLDGQLLVEAEIVFAHLDNTRSNQMFGSKNFVFTQQMLSILEVAKAQERARLADDDAALANGRPDDPERPGKELPTPEEPA
jgi:3-hydroxyacyl-[acyl-carrier-protein] dehydratase